MKLIEKIRKSFIVRAISYLFALVSVVAFLFNLMFQDASGNPVFGALGTVLSLIAMVVSLRIYTGIVGNE